jgi:hypothetical protein
MGLARSTYYAEPASQPIEEARLVERIKENCAEWPAYGQRGSCSRSPIPSFCSLFRKPEGRD